MKRLILVAAVVMSWTLTTLAEELPFLDAQVKTLASFKDGTVFVLKEGTVKVGPSGKVLTSPITDAAFGTVGVNSLTEGVRVKMLAASAAPDALDSTTSFADARSRAHGRPITIRRHGDQESISGELLSLRPPDGVAQAIGLPRVQDTEGFVLSVKQRNGVVSLVPMSEIEAWRFLDSSAHERDPEQTGQHLTITLEGAKPGQEVTVAYYYLWKGVQWTPSYLLEREEDGQVHVELRGEITNRLLDLHRTKLYLVVGVPNFAFIGSPSPLVAQKTLQQVTSALVTANEFGNNAFSNGQFTQLVDNSRASPSGPSLETGQPVSPDARFAPSAELPDVQSTDAGSLHLFEVDDIDLAKGERALIHLSTMDLACRDLVTWDVADARVRTAHHTPTPADRATNPLIHHWVIHAGDVPLTTGPALVMRGDIALSQDRMFYTPRHTPGRYRAGEAVGVVGLADETVLSREAGSKEVKDKQSHYQGKPFWLMREIRWIDETRELTLRVKNGHAFETDMEIARQFSGRPEDTDAVTFQTLGGMDDNRDQLNRLTWKITLQPGEEKELKLTYVARVFSSSN